MRSKATTAACLGTVRRAGQGTDRPLGCGVNACFSGKSYSTFGYGANDGIVPLFCKRIFERMTNKPEPGIEYQVGCGFILLGYRHVRLALLRVRAARFKIACRCQSA